jgi:hypothetical protein
MNSLSQIKMNYWDLTGPEVFESEDDRKAHEYVRALIETLKAEDVDKAETIVHGYNQKIIEIARIAIEMKDQAFAP